MRILFVLLGIMVGMAGALAYADDTNPACTSQEIPGTLTPTYDSSGRLVGLVDHVNRAAARLTFAGAALDDISLTQFIKNRAKPDRYGNSEVWGPTLWAQYNKATGKIAVLHTYEKNRQLTYNIPRDIDFEKLRESSVDHKVHFTGSPEQCDSTYEHCKTLPERTIVLPEPLTANAESCLSFGGVRFALRNTAPTIPAQNVQAQPTEVKAIERKTIEEASGHKVCVDGLCIFVHDDDGAGKTEAE